jgi:hypothetical protein
MHRYALRGPDCRSLWSEQLGLKASKSLDQPSDQIISRFGRKWCLAVFTCKDNWVNLQRTGREHFELDKLLYHLSLGSNTITIEA